MNKLLALPVAGVDSAGLEAAAPLKRLGPEGVAAAALLNRLLVADLEAAAGAAEVLNRLGPELVAGCEEGMLENRVLPPANMLLAAFGSDAWVVAGADFPKDSFGGSAAGVVEPRVLKREDFAGVACPAGVDENRVLWPVVAGAGGVGVVPGALPVLAFMKLDPPRPKIPPPVPGVELLPAAGVVDACLPNKPGPGVPEGVPVEAPNEGFAPPPNMLPAALA